MANEDQLTNLDMVKGLVREFCEARNWDPFHGPKDLAIGLVTEGSELLEHFRFVSEQDCKTLIVKPEQREMIGDELADSLFFILRFAGLYGFDLTSVLKKKLVKNAVKYPAPQK